MKTGDLKVKGIDAVALDLNYLGKPLGKPLHGILGYSLLKDKIFKIDYAGKKIEFFASREALNKSLHNKRYFAEKFVFQEGDIIPVIKNLKIKGRPFIASLDTGSSLHVEIFEHHISRYRIAVDTTARFTITGGQGKAENFHITIDRLSLGDKVFQNLKGGVAKVKNTGQLRMGNIGNGFLKQFKVSFDYVNKEVIFEH